MKEAFVLKSPDGAITQTVGDVAIPEPGPGQVVIEVKAAGLNPKDWKYPKQDKGTNQGDDIAGYVHSVGANVTEFKVGDKVAAFHQIATPHGAYAEYALAWAYTTFHLPRDTSFEEAATIPLAAMTAALGLYQDLGLPLPWNPARKPIPLVIYGGASAVGSFAIKLASLSNIHPIITVAGRGIPSVQGLLDPSKGDTVIDYRKGDEAVVEAFRKALGDQKLYYAFDAISEHNSYVNIGHVLDPSGNIAVVLPGKEYKMPIPVTPLPTYVGSVHSDKNVFQKDVEKVGKLGDKEFGAVFFRLFGRGLAEGWFSGHQHQLVKGGLNGIADALNDMRQGNVSSFKYIVRIADTPGLQ